MPFNMGFGIHQFEAFLEVQQEFVKRAQEFNRSQMEWAKLETSLVSEFAEKIGSARSLPEVLGAYQEWMSRHMQSLAEESRKLVDDSRDLASTTMRLFSDGGKGSS